jgi:hypothetical protein
MLLFVGGFFNCDCSLGTIVMVFWWLLEHRHDVELHGERTPGIDTRARIVANRRLLNSR